MIYWFIGQPGAGKTTLARMFHKYLQSKNESSIHFDGDDLRVIFNNAYGKETFTKEYRIEQTASLQKLMVYIEKQNINVIVSTVNPYKEVRENFKKNNNVTEIYVHANAPRARGTYWVQDYEPPTENFVDIDTSTVTLTESFALVLDSLNKK